MLGLRLRSVPLLLLLAVVGLAVTGALIDRPHTDVSAPAVVRAGAGWDAVVRISRRGRALDGFRPTLELDDGDMRRTFSGREIGPGLYRVQVTLPHPGAYTYRIVVPGAGTHGGTVIAQ